MVTVEATIPTTTLATTTLHVEAEEEDMIINEEAMIINLVDL